jgi:transposase-like protein
MDPIQKAIEEIELREPGASFSYSQTARKYGVVRSTLTRTHQRQNQPLKLGRHFMHPQREQELIQYIKTLTERRIPPTRETIRNFASSLASREASESWVTRFINRHPTNLILR